MIVNRGRYTQAPRCRGKVTADVRRVGLIMRPLLRGGIEERVDIDTRLGDLPWFRPLFCLEVKTYSCFLLLREPTPREEESAYRLQRWWLVTFVSRRYRSRV